MNRKCIEPDFLWEVPSALLKWLTFLLIESRDVCGAV